MFIVVSKWGVLPGKEDLARERSRKVREVLAQQPGVQMMHGFLNADGVMVAVVGYESEEARRRISADPNGPLARALEEHGLNDIAVWVGSDSGESVD